ncbi:MULTISPECIES: helix-turn-helix domain-containing protein [unclassified Polaromonas]|uniref:helix-turn-helix domain-containing protein n=2 Tax=Polaromonas TaxID=52972 RepID=UPI0025FAFF2D|nr:MULTISPECIES: helix-turn-helix domain-containing protein [unclassified Polaromonas]HQR98348.1 helix-turn-helix domain-containing protein [Polaromonas sp.]HQS39217.1 helix-turn-helix domain-containing protein [Polaromonas sp.]HQS86505.1 helix-turn-helix domain-containing protein [Polaromonas sp.]
MHKFVDFLCFVLIIMCMNTNRTTSAQEDMHPADVIAALHKRNLSMRQIAQANGYAHISRVLYGRWLAAEQLVAKALGMKPEDIWPSRYLDPADRARAFQLTRKIKITMPRKQRKASASEARV